MIQASGVGGGSLVYFNVQIEAPERTFQHGWPKEVSRQVLNPYYGFVQDMLDAVPLVLPRAANSRLAPQPSVRLPKRPEDRLTC